MCSAMSHTNVCLPTALCMPKQDAEPASSPAVPQDLQALPHLLHLHQLLHREGRAVQAAHTAF